MLKRLLKNKMALICITLIVILVILGVFAPVFAPNDPYENNILNKFAPYSWEYPLGTDHLGRCVFSRMIYGIRPTLFLSLVTMVGTIGLGTLMGLLSGYFKGIIDDVIMRIVDMMLSFPSQIMILAIVALLGVDIRNVIIANVFIKWAWYARMIRTNVIKYTDKNFILFSRCIGSGERFILFRHMIPCIASEMAVLATLDIGSFKYINFIFFRTWSTSTYSRVGGYVKRSKKCNDYKSNTDDSSRGSCCYISSNFQFFRRLFKRCF